MIDSHPRQAVLRRVTGLARSTPGLLSLIALLLIATSFLTGSLTALSVINRTEALDELAMRSEPLSHAAQEVYRSLQDADATAASAFLSGGLEPADLRQRYEDDIAQAQAALSFATASSPELTATLSSQLPVYTGLIETARTNNRQGFPVGAAYLREASHLMRSQLLPAAQELYRAETERVTMAQDRAARFPWSEVMLGLFALLVLGLAQFYLMKRTNRLLNVGLLTATGAALVALLWVALASVFVVNDVDDSRTGGSSRVAVLAEARIATLTARGDETLTLATRGSGQAYEKNYVEVSERLEKLLDEAKRIAPSESVDSAMRHFRDWQATHQRIREADNAGDYTQAVELIGQPAFDELDADLVDAIAAARQNFSSEIAAARAALAGTVVGVLILALVSAASSTMGLWQRLKEYR